MKNVSFKLNVLEDKKLFKPLFSVLNNSTILPILEDVRIVNNDVLKFISTDLENSICIEKESQSKDEFDFCFNGKKIKAFFNDSLSDEILITGNEEKVSINSGGFNVNIKLDKSAEFPKSHTHEDFISVKINSKELRSVLECAIRFTSNDDLRPAMTGINLIDWGGMLYVAATDVHRLFYKSFMVTPESFRKVSVIIPNKSARLFVEMFNDEEVEIKIEKSHITFSGSGKEIVSRLIGARYPDFEKVIPLCPLQFSLQRKQLKSFLKIAKNFTDTYSNKSSLLLENDGITFTGGDEFDEGEFNYKLPVYNMNKTITSFKFAINIKFLIQAVSINDKDEYVFIEHTGESAKGFIIDKCLLLMPLMTND